ncbi:MAG: peptide deformylase [Candidatus Tagabacteria bacterium]
MNKIKIVQKGDKILTSVAKEIPMADIKDVGIQAIIGNLKRAIAESEEAVAVAAPQIGKSLRIFVVSEYVFSPENKEKKKNDYGYLIFINPKILKKSREQKILTEGCLSTENVYGTIKRSEKIKVEAYNENGKKFAKSGKGLFSQVIQHEIDHLDGILFTNKAIDIKKYEKPKS